MTARETIPPPPPPVYDAKAALAGLRTLSIELGERGYLDHADDIRIALAVLDPAVNSHAALLAAAKEVARLIVPGVSISTLAICVEKLQAAIANAEKDAL